MLFDAVLCRFRVDRSLEKTTRNYYCIYYLVSYQMECSSWSILLLVADRNEVADAGTEYCGVESEPVVGIGEYYIDDRVVLDS